VKGLGKVYIAGILAEIADIRRFPNHHAVAKFGGLAWSRHQCRLWAQQESQER
ncbi:MAG: transposase, partial [Bacillota bacterium]